MILLTAFVLTSCSSVSPPAFQKDRKPESRTEYNGVGGIVQQQRDQSYLRNKEGCDLATKYYTEALNDSSKSKEDIEVFKKDMMDICL